MSFYHFSLHKNHTIALVSGDEDSRVEFAL
jgi:hypothetical protein